MAGEGEEEGVGGAKKWSMDEDKRLINAWINTSSDPIVGAGADQQRKGFWRRVADHFNEHVPHGDSRRTWKTCNSRWNRCAPLVSKWAGIVEETVHLEQSGMSMEDVMPRAHELFVQRTGRTFELDYWWRLLRDQPKWKESYCNDESVGALKCAKVNELGGHSDTSIPGIEDPAAEEGGGLIRRIGRKAAKRKAKEKAAANTIVNLVTNQLSTMGATAVEKVDVFRQYVKVEERKVVLFEEAVRLRERQQAFKERQWEEKVRRMKIADMRSEDAACYGQLQEEIRSKYRQQLPSNE